MAEKKELTALEAVLAALGRDRAGLNMAYGNNEAAAESMKFAEEAAAAVREWAQGRAGVVAEALVGGPHASVSKPEKKKATIHQPVREHFAVGLTVYVRPDALPVGWVEGEDFSQYWDNDDYHRRHPISEVSEFNGKEPESFAAGGWYWDPRDLTIAP